MTAASAVPAVAPCGRLRVPGSCADPLARGPLATSSLRCGRCKRPRRSFPPGPSRFVFVSLDKIQSNHPGTLRIPGSGLLAPVPPTEGTPTPGGEGQRETLAHAQEAKPTSMRQGSHAPVGRRTPPEPAANRKARRPERRTPQSSTPLRRAGSAGRRPSRGCRPVPGTAGGPRPSGGRSSSWRCGPASGRPPGRSRSRSGP